MITDEQLRDIEHDVRREIRIAGDSPVGESLGWISVLVAEVQRLRLIETERDNAAMATDKIMDRLRAVEAERDEALRERDNTNAFNEGLQSKNESMRAELEALREVEREARAEAFEDVVRYLEQLSDFFMGGSTDEKSELLEEIAGKIRIHFLAKEKP